MAKKNYIAKDHPIALKYKKVCELEKELNITTCSESPLEITSPDYPNKIFKCIGLNLIYEENN